MKWTFNDSNSLELIGLDAYFISAEFRLFTGIDLPTLRVVVQYSDDSNHYNLGDEVKGSLSTNGPTFEFTGYVFNMKEGINVVYDILLRPRSYFEERLTNTYSSVKSALDDCESLDTKSLTDLSDCSIHAFGDYRCNLVNRLASGLAKGIYGRSYSKLIFRDPNNDAVDFTPQLNNITINGVTEQVYNKYTNQKVLNEDIDSEWVSIYGGNSDIVANTEYKQFYENMIYNKKFNFGNSVELVCMELLPFEPGKLVDTTNINAQKRSDIPKIMYVRDVLININKSGIKMNVTLAD